VKNGRLKAAGSGFDRFKRWLNKLSKLIADGLFLVAMVSF
jgi:hypothetical protein